LKLETYCYCVCYLGLKSFVVSLPWTLYFIMEVILYFDIVLCFVSSFQPQAKEYFMAFIQLPKDVSITEKQLIDHSYQNAFV